MLDPAQHGDLLGAEKEAEMGPGTATGLVGSPGMGPGLCMCADLPGAQVELEAGPVGRS